MWRNAFSRLRSEWWKASLAVVSGTCCVALLCRHRDEDVDYGDVQYWLWRYRDSWYQQPFDWLGNWKTLSPWIQAVARGRVVHLGCGTSTLAEDMVDTGYKEVWNVDISEECLKAGETVKCKHFSSQ